MSLLPKPLRNLLDDATFPVTVALYSDALEPMDEPRPPAFHPEPCPDPTCPAAVQGPEHRHIVRDLDPALAGLAAFEALVERISYRPGYILRVTHRPPMLRVVAELDDSYHPGQRLEVAMHFPVPDFLLEQWGIRAAPGAVHAEGEMVRWVRRALGWHELHERDEWLRLDGMRPFDPHADDPDGTRLGVRP